MRLVLAVTRAGSNLRCRWSCQTLALLEPGLLRDGFFAEIVFILQLFHKPDLKRDRGLPLPNRSPSRCGQWGLAGTVRGQLSPWLSPDWLQPLPGPEGSRDAGTRRAVGAPGPAAPSRAGPVFLRCPGAWLLPMASVRGRALLPYNLRAFLTLIFLFLF